MTLTVASLCSGYGGLEVALELWLPGSLSVSWHAEVDPDASRVLKTHHPEVPNLGDFTLPDFWENAPRADVHAGGVPCQPFSSAGRQKGADDHRFLWPDWLRGIELQRPATIVFENVANLTRGKMRAVFDQIRADLVALGYDVRWCLLGACAVGAAHHRHRVFLLACRTRTTPSDRQVIAKTCGQHDAAYLPTPSAVRYGSNQGGAAGRVGPVRYSLDSIDNLLPTPVARDADGRGEGGQEYWTNRVERGARTEGMPLGAAINLLPTPAARDGGARGTGGNAERRLEMGRAGDTRVHKQMDLPTTLQLLPTPLGSDGLGRERFGKYAAAVARHASVMGTMPPEPTEIGPRGGRRLAAAFSEWLMMLPAGHVTDVLERSPALTRCGNGVVPLQAATALRLLFEDLTGVPRP